MNPLRTVARSLLRRAGLYHWLRDWRRDRRFRRAGRQEIRRWQAAGRPPPAPDLYKYEYIRACARRHGAAVFVETGTWKGDACFMLRRDFRELHTIELAPALHAAAREELAHLPHVHAYLGDSAVELPRVVDGLAGPVLFWLDGHYCAGPSARGDEDTPISAELACLLRRPPGRDVIMIDDLRCFDGRLGYPTIDALRQLVHTHRPAAHCVVADDIMCIHPV
ncbi:MAG: hypothetical protein KF897_05505 [Opitutaceae bacterium]|nr:hypothetical protein [Opitutaceae bacterium]